MELLWHWFQGFELVKRSEIGGTGFFASIVWSRAPQSPWVATTVTSSSLTLGTNLLRRTMMSIRPAVELGLASMTPMFTYHITPQESTRKPANTDRPHVSCSLQHKMWFRIPIRGHSTSLEMAPFMVYDCLFTFNNNFCPISHHCRDIQLLKFLEWPIYTRKWQMDK